MKTHLCYGPMGAGKSAWLSSHYREHERTGDRVLALYPAGSERWAGPNRIASRNGQEIPAEPIECGLPSLALILAANEHEAIFIDDAHQLERDHAGHWRRQVLESGFKGDLYISTLGLGWDMELLQPARLLLREQLATSRHYLTASCSAHGPRCRAAYSFMIDLDGPVVSDLRTPENPDGNYWALCYEAMLLCYQAQLAGLPLPEYPLPKLRRASDDFNLELAGAAHDVAALSSVFPPVNDAVESLEFKVGGSA